MAKGSKGKVVQVIGTVVDVEFQADELPVIYSAVELQNEGERLVLEVEQHVGNSWARCLALGATEGLARGTEVTDTGSPVMVPVGPNSLGRLMNVLGDPIDGGEPIPADAERWAIHRKAPSFSEAFCFGVSRFRDSFSLTRRVIAFILPSQSNSRIC